MQELQSLKIMGNLVHDFLRKRTPKEANDYARQLFQKRKEQEIERTFSENSLNEDFNKAKEWCKKYFDKKGIKEIDYSVLHYVVEKRGGYLGGRDFAYGSVNPSGKIKIYAEELIQDIKEIVDDSYYSYFYGRRSRLSTEWVDSRYTVGRIFVHEISEWVYAFNLNLPEIDSDTKSCHLDELAKKDLELSYDPLLFNRAFASRRRALRKSVSQYLAQ